MKKIYSEVQLIINSYQADAVVLVSDGEDDEAVVPVLQTLVPIISLQRIIIKHSRSVEYSYAVLGRYVKMLVYDPRYSKFFWVFPEHCWLRRGSLLFSGLPGSSCPCLKHSWHCLHHASL